VLDRRNDLIMNDYSKALTELARVGNMQGDALNLIAREAIKDSRLMKVVAIIGIAYIPASIIAVRFIRFAAFKHYSANPK
jgi:hypothetical protein